MTAGDQPGTVREVSTLNDPTGMIPGYTLYLVSLDDDPDIRLVVLPSHLRPDDAPPEPVVVRAV
jgi:hypothetical protein